MSSSDTGILTRGALVGLALSFAALAGGCFQPLYGAGTASTVGGSVASALRDIEVDEIKGLVGHNLRNELVFDLDGGAAPTGPKRLRLSASISESLEVVTVDAASGRADSAVLSATASWSLTRIGSGEVVASGNSVVRAPYDRSIQRFANVRAARDAQIRAARSLAELIKARIAAVLVA